MDSVQGCLSSPVSVAASVFDAPRRLSQPCVGMPFARTSAWSVLHRLLLGAHGAVVCRWRNERPVDCRPGGARAFRETYHLRALGRALGWLRSCRDGYLDVVLGAAVMRVHGFDGNASGVGGSESAIG